MKQRIEDDFDRGFLAAYIEGMLLYGINRCNGCANENDAKCEECVNHNNWIPSEEFIWGVTDDIINNINTCGE